MYVLFEGIDTVGKSTQIDLLAQHSNLLLQSLLYKDSTQVKAEHYAQDIIITKEPGGTSFGQKAREILLSSDLQSKKAELLLFLADRAEHYEEIIKPNNNKLIISDRGFLSGIGYALASGNFEFDELLQLNRFVMDDNYPDKIILFLTDLKTLKERTSQKNLDNIELRGLDYLMSVQAHMRQSLKKLGIDHLIVDATEPIETIHQNIVSYLQI